MADGPNGVAASTPHDSSRVDRRVRVVIALAIMIAGLLLVVVGVVLGLYTYSSALEQGIRRATVVAVEGLNGAQMEGDAVISGASYSPPGPAEYVMRQPATWLGGTIVFAGLMVLAFSGARDPEIADTPEDQPVGLDGAVPDSMDDGPFDTGA